MSPPTSDERAARLGPRSSRQRQSMTFRVASQVAALRKEGLDIVDLAIGEPDLATPEHIREAAKRAIDEGATRYTESAGRRELRAAASEWLTQAHGVDVKLEQVLVSSGSKQALFSLFQVLLSEGDEVIVPSPLWISYRDMVSFAGGKTVLVSSRTDQPLRSHRILLRFGSWSFTRCL